MTIDSQALELTFDNRLGDHLAAERLYYQSTLFWKLDKVAAILLLAVGAYLTWNAGPHWWTLIWFPLAIAEWFNLLTLRPLQIAFSFKHNPKFRETYHLTLDRAGIQFRTASIDALVKWSHYNRLVEDSRLCLLIYGSRMYSVIPKRVFKSEAELNQFRALVNERMGHGHGSV